MACVCENEDCVQSVVDGVTICTCETVVYDVTCPDGCVTEILSDGNARCICTEQVEPEITIKKTPIYFDNEEYFEDVSWTISYKVTEGTWNSYFSIYPDFSPYHNNFFQVGYNWGTDKGTLWNHLMGNSSFGVFQGKKHTPIIEIPVANENVDKMLTTVSLNLEAVHYQDDWDYSLDRNKSFKNILIYNQTNSSGMLGLNPQKSLSDVRKYPKTNGSTQEILFTSEDGKQNINYFFNRVLDNRNNIPKFVTDENNIFKTVNTNAVKFVGKRVLERMRGESFIIHLEGNEDTRYNLILKNTINNEIIY